MDVGELEEAVGSASAIRRILRLLPVGGDGSYVAPPTYLGRNRAVHVFEVRKIGGRDVQCVLLDSVQSQANRLEDALERAGDVVIPNVYVDFTGDPDVKDLGTVSSLRAPHRIFDAIIRDSDLGGEPFPISDIGRQVNSATPQNATALFAHSPSTLVFGGWNSTGDKGGSGRRFQRCIVSEIVGVDVPCRTYKDKNQETVSVPQMSRKPASRIDPLAIEKVDIYIPKARRSDWQTKVFKGAQKLSPAEVNHGNIPPQITDHGVTMAYAVQTTTITLAGLRRLSFPDPGGRHDEGRNAAARTVLASLALCAITKHDADGYSLRSRCDLYPESRSDEFEIIRNDGRIDKATVTPADAVSMFAAAVERARDAGLPWDAEPRALVPQQRLIDLVKKSRGKRLQDGDERPADGTAPGAVTKHGDKVQGG